MVSFHFGLPDAALVARVKAAGCKIISSATSLREAQLLAERGVDAIIAQGAEAGGHRGMFIETDVATQIGTLALVHEIVNAVRVPVIAAGGIVDGRGIAAAFALGAAGVQIGTAYLDCPEATISPVHRAALAEPDRQTVITNVLSGRPARSILTRFVREQGPLNEAIPNYPLATPALTAAPRQGRGQGLRRFLAVVGRSVPRPQPQPWGRRADQSARRGRPRRVAAIGVALSGRQATASGAGCAAAAGCGGCGSCVAVGSSHNPPPRYR